MQPRPAPEAGPGGSLGLPWETLSQNHPSASGGQAWLLADDSRDESNAWPLQQGPAAQARGAHSGTRAGQERALALCHSGS